jgi:sphingomyelin phosphodiesterase
VAELQEAEAAGQRVWILGHMPMGASDAFHDASYYFGELAILLYTLSRAR